MKLRFKHDRDRLLFRAGVAAGIEAQQVSDGKSRNLKVLDDDETTRIGERVLGDFLCSCDFGMPASSGRKLSHHSKGCRLWQVVENSNSHKEE